MGMGSLSRHDTALAAKVLADSIKLAPMCLFIFQVAFILVHRTVNWSTSK